MADPMTLDVDDAFDDTPPAPTGGGYTILSRAAEIAQRDGREQAEVEGELVEHHQWRIRQEVLQVKTRRAAILAKAARLQSDLDMVAHELAGLEAGLMHETEHDRMVLASYVANAPQYKDAKKRTHRFAWGPIVQRTKTVRGGFSPLNKDALAELLPDFTKPTLQWAAVKPHLVLRGEAILFDETGEVLPEGLVSWRPDSKTETAYTEVEGIKLDLLGEEVSDAGTGDDGADDEFDPFDDPSPDSAQDDGEDPWA